MRKLLFGIIGLIIFQCFTIRAFSQTNSEREELDKLNEQLLKYNFDKEVLDPEVRKIYDRMSSERLVYHIMSAVNIDATPADTLAAYNTILEAQKRLNKGEAFEKVAAALTSDVNGKVNGGRVGWITGFSIPDLNFEDAAFTTKVGGLSPIVRSKYGYHIINVREVRPASGELHVEHLLLRIKTNANAADSAMVKAKIDSIANVIKSENATFEEMVKTYSDDINTKNRNGELDWFGVGKMTAPFEEAAFSIKNVGDISKPVLTSYGWHLIKLIDKRSLPPYEDKQAEIKSRIENTAQYKDIRSAYIENKTITPQIGRTQLEWEQYFNENINELDVIEGVWSSKTTIKVSNEYGKQQTTSLPMYGTYSISKEGDKYIAKEIENVNANLHEEIIFTSTAVPTIYLVNINFPKSNTTTRANVIFNAGGVLEFVYNYPNEEFKRRQIEAGYTVRPGWVLENSSQWIKTSPAFQDNFDLQPKSGSGFAISASGIIATNYHVIENAKTINIRDINSNFNQTFSAKVLVTDKKNDLALIKIEDEKFNSLATIPYTLKANTADVGESIFVLGYPLRATMGDEIKLTNGIISAKTGFQGDITSYQVSAPVQPGNSGGPLFDSQGNLIGIVNAKNVDAENASYAVKATYLMNLIDLLDNPPSIQNINSLNGKTLPQQVEAIKKFVYIIEVN